MEEKAKNVRLSVMSVKSHWGGWFWNGVL
jgi:hypothetical protein